MSGTQFISRMIEVIGEALQVDHFQLVAFDYRQRPFFQQLRGKKPVLEEKERAELINRALERKELFTASVNHGQDILAACFPFWARGQLLGFAYLEKHDSRTTLDDTALDILSSAGPLVKLLSQENSPPEEVRVRPENSGLEFLGLSRPFRMIQELVDKVKEVSSPVLVTGESGTGKELIARIIHHSGPRRRGQFVAVNCSAIPDNLLESELFGYARGAFTGALRDKPGLVEEASGGTFFLDEIGDLSLPLQAKLLRVLQEKEIRRIGENRSRRVDVRFISATHRQLEQEVAAGRFRQDLYFRLRIITIEIPPLRQRPEDILVLVNHFLDKYCQELNRPRAFFSPAALELLLKYGWPGNVRELQNEIQRVLVLAGNNRVIEEEWLSPEIRQAREKPLPDRWDYSRAKAEFEKKFLGEALRHFNFHRARTAAAIGLTRQGLFRLIKKYGLDRHLN
ncbi:MAG: sigma-54 dependent transcriptional regulator [Candidatus Saccharicenans sp.]|nr:sigma-54 dependent transcriptional regulator [Candidatus Saccharicenans sp.]MDH7492717.1 sigma-54 dependent transcriptional regulator [Candidatus Saccharicenans sp.]